MGEILGKHFLGIFGRFPMLEVPDAVHEKLRLVQHNLLVALAPERTARKAQGLVPSALMQGNHYLTQVIQVRGGPRVFIRPQSV